MAEDFGRAFDWNDSIEKDSAGSGFVVLPEGDYPFTIVDCEKSRHAGSAKLPACPKAIVTCRVDGGDFGSVDLRKNLFLHSKVEGLLCAFFTCIGDRKPGERLDMDFDHLVGKGGTCHVTGRKWTGRDGNEHDGNDISRFLEPAGEPDAAPAGTAPAGKWKKGRF